MRCSPSFEPHGEGPLYSPGPALGSGHGQVVEGEPPVRDLFERELDDAKQRLAKQPEVGPVYETVRGHVMRRVLLPKAERHVYYSVDEATKSVVIYVIWGARKGRGPKL